MEKETEKTIGQKMFEILESYFKNPEYDYDTAFEKSVEEIKDLGLCCE